MFAYFFQVNPATLFDSSAMFSLNSNFSLTGMSQLSHPNYNKPKPMQEKPINNNLSNSTLSINTAVGGGSGRSSPVSKKNNESFKSGGGRSGSTTSANLTVVTPLPPATITKALQPSSQPATVSTKNERSTSSSSQARHSLQPQPSSISLKPQTSEVSSSKHMKSTSQSTKYKKSDLAGSSASVVYSSVMGATSLLNTSMLKIPPITTPASSATPTVISNTSSNSKPVSLPISTMSSGGSGSHPATSNTAGSASQQGSSLYAYSNYNVNIIPTESERKQQLTTSVSETFVKEPVKKKHHHRHHHHHHSSSHAEQEPMRDRSRDRSREQQQHAPDEPEAEESSTLIWQKRK
jgi:hypothetical protein